MDEDKWNLQRRRGYLKVHMAVDVKNNGKLSMEVTDEHKHDSRVLPELAESISKQKGNKITKVLAHGAYDSNSIFQFLAENEILPCIRVRKNSKVKKTNQLLGNLSVMDKTNDLGG